MEGKFSFFPEQASRIAPKIDMLYFALWSVTAFFTLAVVAAAIYFVVKYRRRPGNEIATATAESMWLEITWSVIPLIIALGLFAGGAKYFVEIYKGPPDNAIEIFVTGKRWMWKFQHPDGRREINTLHLPVGRAVKLTMISEDVIHGLYIPAFRVQQDVLPYRYATLWFEPTRPGTYHIFCNQYCGTDHSAMVGETVVMSPAEYQAWLSSPEVEDGASRDATVMASNALATAGSAALIVGTDADKGRALLEAKGCRVCHRPGDNSVAPPLEGVWERAQELDGGGKAVVDSNYVRESILNPAAKIVKGYQAQMPTYQGRVSEEDIRLMIAYLKSTIQPAPVVKPAASHGEGGEK